MIEQVPNCTEQAPIYEAIELDLTPSDIDRAMNSYLGYLALPHEEKSKIVAFDPNRPRVGEAGYRLKGSLDKSGLPQDDSKQLFHMHPMVDQKFMGKLNLFNQPAQVQEFLINAQEAYYSLARSTKQYYERLEQCYPGLVDIHFPNGMRNLQNHLRFVAYHTIGSGELARGHYDMGSGTIAVAESHNGLRVGKDAQSLELIERESYQPIFFHGHGWDTMAQQEGWETSRTKAWHDVIDTGEAYSDGVTRWAMIYFIDPADRYHHTTLEQTHSVRS